jgi:L-cysteine:1D-myo-inositol 2-amino-2-deoxy-alpha-D-glucopyranoside ligase
MRSWPEVPIPEFGRGGSFPTLALMDTATSQKKPLPKKETYRMYVCGITPYDATHLGHAATYLSFDLINRYLRASGAKVSYVQNITDIDDPLLERANRDGIDWSDLATQQIDLFRSDMIALRVIPPAHYIGAVEAIPLVVTAIADLQEQESIYPVDSDLYFSVTKDAGFGSRSNLSQEKMLEIFSERGGDPTRPGKKDPLDCLVWMSQRVNEPGWESNLGKGRPGWHIECTAIALEYLDPSDLDPTLIDIQGGGSDLIFPHHEMCAAQAQVITGKELASSYVHTGMIGLDGEKMSKSKGNLVFVSRLTAAGVDPMAIRWALMSDHYRSDRMWSDQVLQQAQADLTQLKKALDQKNCAPTDQLIDLIVIAVSDDLDTPLVLSLLNSWSAATLAGSAGGNAHDLRRVLDALLGLKL